ncbi:hypothetical protein B0H11DRAFT_2191309 [Mycena galericulata]|nr:hypothetical protein B0H11DRAFT_2191309 [Mycena galericulata]
MTCPTVTVANATGAGLPSLVPEALDSVDKTLGGIITGILSIDARHNDNSPVSVLTTVLGRTLRVMTGNNGNLTRFARFRNEFAGVLDVLCPQVGPASPLVVQIECT